jgi:hypothetical protein
MESQAGTVPSQRCSPHFLNNDRDGAVLNDRSFKTLLTNGKDIPVKKPKDLVLTKTITIVQSKHETRVCFTFFPFLQGI